MADVAPDRSRAIVFGNPIRNVPKDPDKYSIDSSGLIIDDIYSLRDVVSLFVPLTEDIPDPRWYKEARGRNWRWNTRPNPPATGWVSPAEIGGSQTLDDTVLQYNFDREQAINQVSFEIANVPCNWSVWYYANDRGLLVQMTDIDGVLLGGSLSGKQLVGQVSSSQNAITQGDFVRFAFKLSFLNTSQIEIHLDRRLPDQLLPTYARTANLPLAYALAVRNVRFKYVVRNRDDLPDEDDDYRFRHPLGFIERIEPHYQDADRVLDLQNKTFWLSEPQPVATSVVPLYLDLRDANGGPVSVDRLRLVPMFSGPTLNVYWSVDDTAGSFRLSRSRLKSSYVGGASRVDDLGLLCDASGEASSYSNDKIRMDFAKDWAIGVEYRPNYPQNVGGSTSRWLWEWAKGGSTLGLRFNPSNVKFELVQNGTTVLFASASPSFVANQDYAVVVGYNHDNSDPDAPIGYYFVFAPVGTFPFTVQHSTAAAPASFIPSTFTLGNRATPSLPAQGYLRNVWVRLDTWFLPAISSFVQKPDKYARGRGQAERANGHFNTIFKARFVRTDYARVGPDDGYYEIKEWNPIHRDYRLRRGVIRLPPVNAKFLKLEFSNLVPRPYQVKGRQKLWARQFPPWVDEWYDEAQRQSPQSVRYIPQVIPDQFEGMTRPPSLYKPGIGQFALQEYLMRAPGVVLHDQGFGSLGRYRQMDGDVDDAQWAREIGRSSLRKRFYRTSRHEYIVTEMEALYQQAFFVGVREVQAYRHDFTPMLDMPEYLDMLGDASNVESNTGSSGGWASQPGGGYVSRAPNDQLTTKTFQSFSKFRSLQIAVMASNWESQMSDGQMSLVTYDHITDLTQTVRTVVTGEFVGSGAGNLLLFTPAGTPAGGYGTRTNAGIFTIGPPGKPYDEAAPFDTDSSYDDVFRLSTTGSRISAVARFLLPETNLGTYELRLYCNHNGVPGTLVARKIFTAPVGAWYEAELGYISDLNDSDFQASIVQANGQIPEPFVLDFLGVFWNPVRWEISNDAGATWQQILMPLNNPDGFVTLKAADSRLKLRITALRAGATLAGYTLVPWYVDSPLVRRIPIDYNPPWGVSENEDLRATKHKAMFALWHSLFPQRYSLKQIGSVPTTGRGFIP